LANPFGLKLEKNVWRNTNILSVLSKATCEKQSTYENAMAKWEIVYRIIMALHVESTSLKRQKNAHRIRHMSNLVI